MIPARVKDYEFAKMWSNLCEDIFLKGKVRPHNSKLERGELRGVLDGLQKLREERVSGEKLVYRLMDGETG